MWRFVVNETGPAKAPEIRPMGSAVEDRQQFF
jgi:hypothetical protein